jgi:hypothetical protein
MYLIKKSILKSFEALVVALSGVCLAGAVLVLGAQWLAEIERLERYPLLSDIVLIERWLIDPAAGWLRANAPLTVSGVDLAPYLIAVAIIVLWVSCEGERHRLRVMDWDLEEERAAARAWRYAAQERARAAQRQAELARLHAREAARLAAEASSRARAEFVPLQADGRVDASQTVASVPV